MPFTVQNVAAKDSAITLSHEAFLFRSFGRFIHFHHLVPSGAVLCVKWMVLILHCNDFVYIFHAKGELNYSPLWLELWCPIKNTINWLLCSHFEIMRQQIDLGGVNLIMFISRPSLLFNYVSFVKQVACGDLVKMMPSCAVLIEYKTV